MNQTWKTTLTALAIAALAPSGALADDANLTDAEVRKIDAAGGRVTLKHGVIKNLDMPAMTMVFVVKDKRVLERLKVGDKVRFKATDEGGKLTASELRAAP